jgi:hypothetical protein
MPLRVTLSPHAVPRRCGSYGSENYKYHQEDGTPVVNTDKFPNMKKSAAGRRPNPRRIPTERDCLGAHGSQPACASGLSRRAVTDKAHSLGLTAGWCELDGRRIPRSPPVHHP